ncbi:MAG: tRNA (adenosine(37)-N6)-threonylcarbamoyltransferase complex transferase subunit TsaD [Patescibacteria group bacterium]|nr:tRNA (adenosine(37)-N6)-threonylcarbamoyltransferase complex transferase subunit TsaD [Patescibacteria group bacterium]
MLILGIETSCDETAASIIKDLKRGKYASLQVLSNIISSQIKIHKQYGGVVPEVAAREHVLNILPVIDKSLAKAGLTRKTAMKKLNAIAVATGPGLITSLISGIETAKILGYTWDLPLIGINHIEGHIYANFIHADPAQIKNIILPAIILTVSGGHTMLILMKGHGKYQIIGETRDDAAGEAFDKAAQLMGIGYPGGPIISQKAQSVIHDKKYAINLPRPMINVNNFDFSFSGLKTALRYALKNDKNWKEKIPAYAFEFQQAVIDVLIHKTIKAAAKYNTKTIMLAGGVSANIQLREQMAKTVKNKIPSAQFKIPNLKYTTDNAAMIAAAGYFHALRKDFTPWQKLQVDCNAKLK